METSSGANDDGDGEGFTGGGERDGSVDGGGRERVGEEKRDWRSEERRVGKECLL